MSLTYPGGGNGFNRALCAPVGVNTGTCQWGSGRVGKACNSKCDNGWLTVTRNSHIGGQKSGCKSGTYAPFCCQSITALSQHWCYATTTDHLLSGSLAGRTDTSGVSDFDYAAGVGPNVNRRDLATKEIRNKTEKRDIKSRKPAVKKRSGTGYGCIGSGYLPLYAIPVDIPAHIFNYPVGGSYSVRLSATATPSTTQQKAKKTIEVHQSTTSMTYTTVTRTCDGSVYLQACAHYSSVGLFNRQLERATCSVTGVKSPDRPLTRLYDYTSGITQHNLIWSSTWITKTYINPNNKRTAPRCQRDEWPPAHFQQGRPAGYIRLLPGSQNSGVANSRNGWRSFCKFPADQQVKVEGGPINYAGAIVYTTIITSTIITLSVLEYNYINIPQPVGDPYLLTTNPCYPSTLTNEPGFALLTQDPYYFFKHINTQFLPYSAPPGSYYTSGKKPPTKRWLGDTFATGSDLPLDFVFDEDAGILVDEGNTTRRAYDEEIAEHLDLQRCVEPDCADERAKWNSIQQELQHKSDPAALLIKEPAYPTSLPVAVSWFPCRRLRMLLRPSLSHWQLRL